MAGQQGGAYPPGHPLAQQGQAGPNPWATMPQAPGGPATTFSNPMQPQLGQLGLSLPFSMDAGMLGLTSGASAAGAGSAMQMMGLLQPNPMVPQPTQASLTHLQQAGGIHPGMMFGQYPMGPATTVPNWPIPPHLMQLPPNIDHLAPGATAGFIPTTDLSAAAMSVPGMLDAHMAGIAPMPPMPKLEPAGIPQHQQRQHEEYSTEEDEDGDEDEEDGAEAKAAQEATERLYAYIKELGGDLEPGWVAVFKKRATGTTAGQMDSYFYSPEGKRYRSRQAIAKHLNLVSDGKASSKGDGEAEGGRKGPRARGGSGSGAPEVVWNEQLPGQLSSGVSIHSLGALQPGLPGQVKGSSLLPVGLTTSRIHAVVRPLPQLVTQAASEGSPLSALGQGSTGQLGDPATDGQQFAPAAGPAGSITLVSQIQEGDQGIRCCVYAVLPGGTQHMLLGQGPTPETAWQTVWESQRQPWTHVKCRAAAAAAAKLAAAQAAGATVDQALAGIGMEGMAGRITPSLPAAPTPPPADGEADTAAVERAAQEKAVQDQMVAAALAAAENLGDVDVAAAAEQAVAELTAHEALLACMARFEVPPWGREEFGLTDMALLQALEQLPGAEQCEGYQRLADRPGGVAAEGRALAKEATRVARDATRAGNKARGDLDRAAAKAATAALKPKKRTAAAGAGGAANKRARTGDANAAVEAPEAAGDAGMPWLADPAQHPDGFLAGVIAAGRGFTEGSRTREAVARVLDRMVTKLEEKTRKDKEREDAKAARQAQRAADGGSKRGGGGRSTAHVSAGIGSAPATPYISYDGDQQAADVHEDAGGPQGRAHGPVPSVPPSAPQPLSAVMVEAVLQGVMDEQQASAQQDGADAAPGEIDAVRQYISMAVRQLTVSDWTRLVQVWDFIARFHHLFALPTPLSLADTLLMLLPAPDTSSHVANLHGATNGDTNGGGSSKVAAGEQLVQLDAIQKLSAAAAAHLSHVMVCLTRWVVEEVFYALVAHMTDSITMKKKDLQVAVPVIDELTWQEVARRYLLGVVASHVLTERAEQAGAQGNTASTGAPGSSKPGEAAGGATGKGADKNQAAGAPLQLPAPLAALNLQGWLLLLLGGLPFEPQAQAGGDQAGDWPMVADDSQQGLPEALRTLLLPPYSTKYAADAIMAQREAAALAAAEGLMQQFRLDHASKSSPTSADRKPHGEVKSDAHIKSEPEPHAVQAPAIQQPEPAPVTVTQQPTQPEGPPVPPAQGDAKPKLGKFKIKIKGLGGAGGGGSMGGAPSVPATPTAAAAAADGAGLYGLKEGPAGPAEDCYEQADADTVARRVKQDVLCGRQLLLQLCAVKSKKGGAGWLMGFCATELTTLLKMARGVDWKAIAARLDTHMYQATGYPIAALTADIRALCQLWRAGADKVSHWGQDKAAQFLPFGFDLCGANLADGVDQKAQQLLASFHQLLPSPQPAATGHSSTLCITHGTASQRNAAAAAATKQEGQADQHAGQDAARLFNPMPEATGCRACWRRTPATTTDIPAPLTITAAKAGPAGVANVLLGQPASTVTAEGSEPCLLRCSCCQDEYHSFCAAALTASSQTSAGSCLLAEDSMRSQGDEGALWLCPACRPLVPSSGGLLFSEAVGLQPEEDDSISMPPHVANMLEVVRLLGQHDLMLPPKPAGADTLPATGVYKLPSASSTRSSEPGAGKLVPGSGSKAVAGWDVRSRLDLLHMFVEAACETALIRDEMDRQAEARDRARKEHVALKAKMRKGQQESAAAAAAAAGTDEQGNPIQPTQGAGGSSSSALTLEEAARLAQLNALESRIQMQGGEEHVLRRACLGQDRHGNRYWYLGPPAPADAALPSTPMASVSPSPEDASSEESIHPCIMIEVAQTASDQPHHGSHSSTPHSSMDGRVAVAQMMVGGWEGWNAAVHSSHGGAGGHPVGGVQAVGRTTSGRLPVDLPPAGWAVYTDVGALSSLIAHLVGGRDSSEGQLRTALTRIKNAMLQQQARPRSSAGSPMDMDANTHQRSSSSGGTRNTPSALQCTILEDGDGEGGSVGAAAMQLRPEVPEGAWCSPSLLQGLQQQPQEAAASQAFALLHKLQHTQHATKLRQQLQELFDSMSVNGLREDSFWGSLFRQAHWQTYLKGCDATPQHLCAALNALEGMLADAAYKPHARHVTRPPMHPFAAATWASVYFRLSELQAAAAPPAILPPTALAVPSALTASPQVNPWAMDIVPPAKPQTSSSGRPIRAHQPSPSLSAPWEHATPPVAASPGTRTSGRARHMSSRVLQSMEEAGGGMISASAVGNDVYGAAAPVTASGRSRRRGSAGPAPAPYPLSGPTSGPPSKRGARGRGAELAAEAAWGAQYGQQQASPYSAYEPSTSAPGSTQGSPAGSYDDNAWRGSGPQAGLLQQQQQLYAADDGFLDEQEVEEEESEKGDQDAEWQPGQGSDSDESDGGKKRSRKKGRKPAGGLPPLPPPGAGQFPPIPPPMPGSGGGRGRGSKKQRRGTSKMAPLPPPMLPAASYMPPMQSGYVAPPPPTAPTPPAWGAAVAPMPPPSSYAPQPEGRARRQRTSNRKYADQEFDFAEMDMK